jgi:Lipocalin-like domain
MAPIAESCLRRSWRFQAFEIHISIRMTRPVPAAIDDRKNEIGITGDHHCGASVPGISRNNDPSELWCIVDSVTAAMASMIGGDTALYREALLVYVAYCSTYTVDGTKGTVTHHVEDSLMPD